MRTLRNVRRKVLVMAIPRDPVGDNPPQAILPVGRSPKARDRRDLKRQIVTAMLKAGFDCPIPDEEMWRRIN